MTQTEKYVRVLTELKEGELGLLRTHAGQGLDESVRGFDLFTGMWWPLREASAQAPRREVAWLVAKLYAQAPMPHRPDYSLARQLRRCMPDVNMARERFLRRFDSMLMLPLHQVEPELRWALDLVRDDVGEVDWVRLTNELSQWERESIRQRWAEEILGVEER